MGSSWCHIRVTADRRPIIAAVIGITRCFRIPEECERSGRRCLCWSRLVGTEQSAGLPLRECLTREEKIGNPCQDWFTQGQGGLFKLSSAHICTEGMPGHSLILSQSSSHRFGRIIRFSLLIWVPAVCCQLLFTTEFMQKKENTGWKSKRSNNTTCSTVSYRHGLNLTGSGGKSSWQR